MSWIKQVFTDFQTVITANFLNDLQDQIIADETAVGGMVSGVKGNSENSYRHGNVNLTKANIGLGNVDNTSDAQKPVSNATQDALDSKVDKVTGKGLSTNDYTTAEKQKVAASALQTDLDVVDDRVDQIYNGGVLYDITTGDIAAFVDGADNMPMKALVATIEPVQDLHGYDYPWPGGASKNKLDLTQAAGTYTVTGVTFVVNDDGTITCNGTNTGSEILFNFTDIIPNNFNGDILSGAVSANLGIACSFYQTSTGTYVTARVDTGNGTDLDSDAPYCRFAVRVPAGSTVNGTVKPMVRLASESDATFVPYKNICPISGWTGLSGKRTGKNLIDLSYSQPAAAGGTYTSNGVTATVDAVAGTVLLNGTATARVFINVTFNASFESAQSLVGLETADVILTCEGIAPGMFFQPTVFYSDRTYSSPSSSVSSEATSRAFTIPNNCVKFRFYFQIEEGTTLSNLVVKPMLRLAAYTDSTFEPYEGDTLSVNWQSQAGTVYGGTVDVISGKLVALYKLANLVGSSGESWGTYDNGYRGFALYLSDANVDGIPKDQLLSNRFVGANGRGAVTIDQGEMLVYTSSSTNKSVIFTTDITDKTSWLAWLADNNIQLVYPLATPIEYQLTPQEVTTLLGNNVVYTDVGPVSVTAPRDTKMYVDNKIAEAVAAALNA